MICSFCDKHAYTTMRDKFWNKYYVCIDHVKKIKTLDVDKN